MGAVEDVKLTEFGTFLVKCRELPGWLGDEPYESYGLDLPISPEVVREYEAAKMALDLAHKKLCSAVEQFLTDMIPPERRDVQLRDGHAGALEASALWAEATKGMLNE